MKYYRIIALFFGFLITHMSLASVITVDNNCSLANAIESANSNTAVSTCVAGDDAGGSDSIELSADIVLNTFFDDGVNRGWTGTPAVTSNIVLDGNGSVIERDSVLTKKPNFVAVAWIPLLAQARY